MLFIIFWKTIVTQICWLCNFGSELFIIFILWHYFYGNVEHFLTLQNNIYQINSNNYRAYTRQGKKTAQQLHCTAISTHFHFTKATKKTPQYKYTHATFTSEARNLWNRVYIKVSSWMDIWQNRRVSSKLCDVG